MGAVPFDTLKLARRLESAGFSPKQAGDTAEALAEAMSGAELATTTDIGSVRTEIAALRAELDWFLPRVQARLFPGVPYTVREEGNLLYGGRPRPIRRASAGYQRRRAQTHGDESFGCGI